MEKTQKLNVSHYNKMYDALKTIAKGYQTPEQLRRNSKGLYGLGYEESLEMAYENLQQTAKEGIKNVRRFQPSQESDRDNSKVKTMKVIHKFPLQITDEQQIEIPQHPVFLTAQMQGSNLFLWAIVDTDKPKILHTIRIVGTGHPFPDHDLCPYIATVQNGGFVWHVFSKYKG